VQRGPLAGKTRLFHSNYITLFFDQKHTEGLAQLKEKKEANTAHINQSKQTFHLHALKGYNSK
jgi:hypothetical protein